MPIKTLIVDDTILYRKIASDVAASFAEVEVVGTAPNGDLALKKMAQQPVDLVLCDVHMPVMDGVETLDKIIERFPDTIVVMMSGISSRSADITIKALEMGAVDFIKKPDSGTVEENFEKLKQSFQNVLRLVQIRLNTGKILRKTPAPSQPVKPALPVKPVISKIAPKTFGVLAIGVSTGGPEALSRVIPALSAKIPVPIVLVQHMPPKFTQSLAESLDRKSGLKVIEAADKQELKPGVVYIAPGGRHMTVRRNEESIVTGLNDGPPENSCRPAVDVLFRSVASVYGDTGTLAVILTGMGSDGLNGVRTLKRKSCYCISQSESTCVVYGMPRAIDEANLADVSLPLEKIAGEICKKFNC